MAPEALYDEIQTIAARYPERLSAVMPALRLAQERYGWLPRTHSARWQRRST